MIDNATRAAYDAIFRHQGTLQTISHAVEHLAHDLDPDTDPGHALHAIAGDAWAHRQDGLDIMQAATYDGELAAGEVRAWLERVVQIIDRARLALP